MGTMMAKSSPASAKQSAAGGSLGSTAAAKPSFFSTANDSISASSAQHSDVAPGSLPMPAAAAALATEPPAAEDAFPRSRSETPYSLVAQVLSLGSGTVRLSWLFDWDVAPADLITPSEGGAVPSRSFRVKALRRNTSTADQGEPSEHTCTRPQLELALEVGHRYAVEVVALIHLPDNEAPAWESKCSVPVFADLRGAPSPTVAAVAGPRPASSAGRSAETDGRAGTAPADNVRLPGVGPRGGTIASRLGTFLARPRPAAAPERVLSARSTPTAATSSSSAAPDTATAAAPAATDGPDSPVHSSPVGTAAPGCSSPNGSNNPMLMSKPRVVDAPPLDPYAEKRRMAGRLLARRGGTPAARDEMTLDQKLRSDSMDGEEEGSLQQLCLALSHLERSSVTQQLRPPSSDGVDERSLRPFSIGEEGQHGLRQRLDKNETTEGTDELRRGQDAIDNPFVEAENKK